MLTVYDNLLAYYPSRVRLMLLEKGLNYKAIEMDLFNGESLTPEFAKISPQLTLPVLQDGDKVMTESLDIIHYLNDLDGNPLGKVDPEQVNKWVNLIAPWNGNVFMTAVQPDSVMAIFKKLNGYKIKFCQEQIKEHPELASLYQCKIDYMLAMPSDQVKEDNIRQIKSILEECEGQLEHSKFIAGNDYTIADVLLTCALVRIQSAGQSAMVKPLKHLSQYFDRIQQRPSFQKTFKATLTQKVPALTVLPALVRAAFCEITAPGVCSYKI